MEHQERFNLTHVGCYADGAFGHQHCRKVLGALVEGERPFEGTVELADSLYGPMPDDAWDEDEALDILNDATSDDCYWTFDSGDLMLMNVDGEQARYQA